MDYVEKAQHHAQLEREHRASARFATDDLSKHYHTTLADHHAAKASDARQRR